MKDSELNQQAHIWVSSLFPGGSEHFYSRNSSEPTYLEAYYINSTGIKMHETYLFISLVRIDDIIYGK